MKNKILIFSLLFLGSFFSATNVLAWSLCSLDNGSKICGDVTYMNQHPTVKCNGNYTALEDCKKLETGQTVFWNACTVASTGNITCTTNPYAGCGTVKFNSLDDCKKTITLTGKKYQDTISQADIDAAVKSAAAKAKVTAEAKKASDEAYAKIYETKEALKKALAEDQKQAAEMVCDCSKTGGQCRDNFTSMDEAQDYCNSCGITLDQNLSGQCPLGSTELGPFSCSCGKGEDLVCAVYDTYSELKAKCIAPCNPLSGDCTANTSISIENLKKEAKKLNPAGFLTGTAGVREIIGRIIIFLLFPIGMFTMALYIWAGFLWMTAQGNSENVTKSKQILVWTTLGVVISLASYLIVKLVFEEILL